MLIEDIQSHTRYDLVAASTVNVFELEGGTGVVVFRQVNGKLVSRMYRAQA